MSMKHQSYFEFIGDTDAGLGYVHGNEYALIAISRTLLERTLNSLRGIPFSWKIVIVSPIHSPYLNRDDFNANWRHTRESFSSE